MLDSFLKNERETKANGIWMYRKTMRMLWIVYVCNEEVLMKMETNRTLMLRTHYLERGFGEVDTLKTSSKQERLIEAAKCQPNEFE